MHKLPDDRRPARHQFQLRLLVLAALGIGAAGLVLSWPPLPQDPAYHAFADQRTLLGIPHGLNVVSNLPFLLVGVPGLWFVLGRAAVGPGSPFLDARERWPYALFFLGVAATAFGSAYYHLEPNNERLLWDRLPITVAFMSLFAAIIAERINLTFGLWLLPVLVAAGVASVLYWHWTETQNRGDLRFYLFVTYYPILTLPLLLLLFPARYTKTAYLWGVGGWYVLAKVCEHGLDVPLYSLGGVVSGHTLKHLTAAVAAYWVLVMLWRRQPIPSPQPAV